MSHDELMKNDTSRMALYDWVQCIVAAVVSGILIFTFIGRVDGIKGTSMIQTLQDGDTVLLSDLFFTPKYGDIVFIKTETYGDTPIVKRVIATAGQTIDIDFVTGDVTVDGSVLRENYINTPTTTSEGFDGPVTIPDGCVFVMGDNRNDSMDSRSREIGYVDTRQIIGKVLLVLIPGRDLSGARSWSRFGSVYKGFGN